MRMDYTMDIGEFLGILCQENLLYQHNQAGSSSGDKCMCDDNISSAIMKNNHCSITDIVACEHLYGKCLESFEHELLRNYIIPSTHVLN